jgi:hypothetical protein
MTFQAARVTVFSEQSKMPASIEEFKKAECMFSEQTTATKSFVLHNSTYAQNYFAFQLRQMSAGFFFC